MRKILASALLFGIMAMAVAPAHAQSNSELVRETYDAVMKLTGELSDTVWALERFAGELQNALERFESIQATNDRNTEILDKNAESLYNIEMAIYGQVCGTGTTNVAGMCMPTITHCGDGTYHTADMCLPDIVQCGQGTILHLDTCIADVSVSYCGEGTVFEGGVCVAASDGPTWQHTTEPDSTDRHIVDGTYSTPLNLLQQKVKTWRKLALFHFLEFGLSKKRYMVFNRPTL